MEKEMQREMMLCWAEKQQWKREEKKLRGVAEEIAELVFWSITVAKAEKSVRVHRKER